MSKQTTAPGEELLRDRSRRAVQREAQLAASEVAQGATVLRRANHAQPGLYAQAFFSLSIGLERMGKLVFLADHAIQHGGRFPNDEDLRAIGHDVKSLFAQCEATGAHLDQDRPFAARPSDPIHRAIEDVLSLFARKLRYYNLNYLAGSHEGQDDPIALWWEQIAVPICERYYSKRQREVDERDAKAMRAMFADAAIFLHAAEDGHPMTDIQELYTRGRATRVVQRYGQLYVLQITRWLASILFELSHQGGYVHCIQPLLGLHEPFAIFYNEDKYFRSRKTWSIYPR
jgi:hypothetical protein